MNTNTIKKVIRNAGGIEVRKIHGNLGRKKIVKIDQIRGGFSVEKLPGMNIFQVRFYGDVNQGKEKEIAAALVDAGYGLISTEWGFEIDSREENGYVG